MPTNGINGTIVPEFIWQSFRKAAAAHVSAGRAGKPCMARLTVQRTTVNLLGLEHWRAHEGEIHEAFEREEWRTADETPKALTP